ncbi:MAG: tetratricopeptide repeat protein [Acidobacteria bacterium]|nr:tetratricopeptide repeat protein [Acidobacteriota bacterium]
MYELFELGRYADAEKEIRRNLAVTPDDGRGHAMLAWCMLQLDRPAEALESAERAVGLAPDMAVGHSVRARAYLELDRTKDALGPAREALRLEPSHAAHHGLLAAIHLRTRDFEQAVAFAESGLDLDAEDATCQNIRAIALSKLDRPEQAAETIDTSLALDPEDPMGHASKGWVLVQRGGYKEAQASFREALRLDPQNEWAREGLAQTIKAGNLLYRLMFRWQLWMSTLKNEYSWAVLLGLYFGQRLLRALANSYPALAPFVTPLLILYFLFALLTWFGSPVANLLLRLHPLGKYLLDREQLQASKWFGGLLAAALAAGGAAWALDSGNAFIAALVLLVLGLLTAAVLESSRLRRSRVMRIFLGAMAVTGLLLSLTGSETLGGLFLLGLFAFGWVANATALRH